jgi:hypothetical protein
MCMCGLLDVLVKNGDMASQYLQSYKEYHNNFT